MPFKRTFANKGLTSSGYNFNLAIFMEQGLIQEACNRSDSQKLPGFMELER
jgi:hypothetical protein